MVGSAGSEKHVLVPPYPESRAHSAKPILDLSEKKNNSNNEQTFHNNNIGMLMLPDENPLPNCLC